MALNFPDNPPNGEKYVASNGVEYTYESSNDTWTGNTADLVNPANPDPSDVSAVPPFDGGSGTKADPYIITPAIVQVPGGTATSAQLITIVNQPALSIGTWEVQAGGVSRFTQPFSLFNSAGTWQGNLDYEDVPPSEASQVYEGLLVIGSVYFSWDVIQIANKTVFSPENVPNASPKDVSYPLNSLYGTVSGTYADDAGTLTATGGVKFSVNSGADVTTSTIAQGETLNVFFDTETVDSTFEGGLVSGSITNNSGFLLLPSIVVDRSPIPYDIGNLENAPLSSVVTSDNLSLTGFNSRSYVSLGTGLNTLTDIEASVGGRAFAEITSTISYLSLIRPLETAGITAYNDSTKVLTFSADTDLSLFTAADAVRQDTNYTPVTSAITVVDTISGDWTAASAATAIGWQSVVYGAGKFVAVAEDGTNRVMYSANGINWTSANVVEANSWQSITYGLGDDGVNRFVAVALNGTNRAMYSTDGISWTAVTTPQSNNWYAVTYGGGKFVALSQSGTNRVMYSTNGITWTLSNTQDAFSWNAITYGLQFSGTNTFLAVGTDGMNSSSDGITWATVTQPATNNWSDTAYGNGTFVAVGTNDNKIAYGTNVTSLSYSDNTSATGFRRVAYGNNVFVAISLAYVVFYSSDGINWTQSQTLESNIWKGLTYGGDKFVAVAESGTNRVTYSATGTGENQQALTFTDNKDLANFRDGDAVNKGTVSSIDAGNNKMTVDPISGAWTSSSATENNGWRSIIYGNGKYVSIADNGTNRVMWSDDATSWTAASAAENNAWNSVTYGEIYDGAKRFVAVAGNGTNRVMYSDDGVNWTIVTSTIANATNDWQSVTYGNGKFVAVQYTGSNTMYSTDGITWSSGSGTIQPNGWTSVTYGNGKYLAVAATGTNRVMYSNDGIGWTSSPSAIADQEGWNGVTYGGGQFVAVADNGTNQVMYSTDGISWTGAAAAEANTWNSVTYGEGKYVAVASTGTNRVMWSDDAINWTAASAAEPAFWFNVTYGGGKFVAVAMGGTYQVMYSYTGNGEDISYATTETVTGPLLTAPTGVFASADVSAKTMTLTSTNATGTTRWVVNGGRTVIGPPVDVPDPVVPNIFIDPGETMYIRGTTGSTANTDYFASIKIGNTTENWTVKTTDGSPEIQQPSIVLPVNGATGIVPDIELVSSSYVGLDSPGSHASSDWQVYEASLTATSTGNITAVEAQSGGWNSASAAAASGWRSVAYGNGKFVAVADSSTSRVMYSSDGISWSTGTMPQIQEGLQWQDVTFGNGKFVAVAISSTQDSVIYSTDGINWTAAEPAAYVDWRAVGYGNGRFVALQDSGGGLMYSGDGVTWTLGAVTLAGDWTSIAYGGGKFVAVGKGKNFTQVIYSTDGLSWTGGTPAEANYWFSVAYGSGKYVAVSSDGTNQVMYSTDGASWTSATATSNIQWKAVVYGGGQFVAVATNGTNQVMYSADGINWTTGAVPAESTNWYSIAYGDSKFVSVSASGKAMWSYTAGADQTILTLADSSNFGLFQPGQSVAQNSGSQPNTAVYTEVTLVQGGWNGGNVPASSGNQPAVGFIAASPTAYIATNGSNGLAGVKNVIRRSTNGNTWTTIEDISTNNNTDGRCAYGAGIFTWPGAKLYSTDDGATWQASSTSNPYAIQGGGYIFGGTSGFVAFSSGGFNSAAQIQYSGDGQNWTNASFNTTEVPAGPQSAAYGNATWLYVGAGTSNATSIQGDTLLKSTNNGATIVDLTGEVTTTKV